MTDAKRKVEEMLDQREKRGEKRGREEGEKRGKELGEKKGMARVVLHLLKVRGIRVSQSLRQRIASCTDVQELTTWVERAAVANSADDLFATAAPGPERRASPPAQAALGAGPS